MRKVKVTETKNIQELFIDSLQKQSDHFDIIKDDLDRTLAKLPIKHLMSMISDDPNDLKKPLKELHHWIDDNLKEQIEDNVHEAQHQALTTTAHWIHALGVGK